MPRVVHFEIAAQEPERALKFYADVFDWSAQKWGPEEYWLLKTGEDGEIGINGGLARAKSPEGFPNSVNTIDVESIDAYIEKVTANGGTVAVPKMTVPTIGYLCYCKDTEGNLFGLMQPDPTAAA